MKIKTTIKTVATKTGTGLRHAGKWTWLHKKSLVVHPLAVLGAMVVTAAITGNVKIIDKPV